MSDDENAQEPTSPLPQGEGQGQGEPTDDPRIAELTAHLEASAVQLAELTGALQQEQQTTQALTAALATAAAAYRTAALATVPEVPPELVGGETVEAVQASIQRAKELVEAVKARLPAPAPPPGPTVPAGAPARTGPDLGAMSPTEKIKFALATENGGRG